MFRPFLVGAALVLAGCSSGEVTLGVQITPQVGNAAAALQTNRGVASRAQPQELVTALPVTAPSTPAETPTLSRVRVLLSEAELKSGDSSGRCPNMGPSAHIESPAVINLSADDIKNGTTRLVSLGAAAAGTYNAGELEIEPLDADDAAATPELAEFKKDGATVIVNGTFQGKDFEFRGHFKAEQTAKGPIDVGSGKTSALSLTIDPTNWFKDANGAQLDPTDASLHDTIAKAICTTLDLEPQEAAMHFDAKGDFGHHRGGDFAPRARCVEGAISR